MRRILVLIAAIIMAFVFLRPVISETFANAVEPKSGLSDRQKKVIDSLCEVVLGMEKRLNINDLKLNSCAADNAKLLEKLDHYREENRNSMIYVIILFSLVLLLSIFLLIRIWYRHNKRLNSLDDDQEKTNEALNLHIQNTSQEISGINDELDRLHGRNGAE